MNNGLGLVAKLRECLPTTADGLDYKTWCSVLGSDLRDAAIEIERFRAALEIVRQYPDFDSGGPLPEMMDQVLRGEPSTMLDFLDWL